MGICLVDRYGRSHLVTLVERHSSYLIVLPLTDATTTTVVPAVTAAVQQLPPLMRRSLTWDRGVGMTRHADFTTATCLPVYFCDACCPWQASATKQQRPAAAVPSQEDRPVRPPRRAHPGRRRRAEPPPRQTLLWQTPHEVFWSASLALIA